MPIAVIGEAADLTYNIHAGTALKDLKKLVKE